MVERHRRDKLIMERMYGLEILRHQNGRHASTDMQLATALLGISLEFRQPIKNDILTDEENIRTGSDMDSDSEEEIYPAQADDEVDGGDAMED
ncbi:hypothetical protein H5410_045945 [Solanum commersonii]|uniref:Uncharacterized protein n=1 Tax=Solanum commersonii TaxID=4109 RepID=A0A9J5XD34_SOLCO|nr:hypothetical protein H5410_045945 [Solanum commersonii]